MVENSLQQEDAREEKPILWEAVQDEFLKSTLTLNAPLMLRQC